MTTASVALAAHSAQAVTPTNHQEVPKGAVSSLVFGILSFFIPFIGFFLAILAIDLGNRARKKPNGGMGLAGFVMGIITTSLYGFMIVYFIGVAIFIWASVPGAAG